MTRVDFYVLPDAAGSTDDVLSLTCRLCDKAVAAGQCVYVHVPDPGAAEALDALLWSFRQGSFIAHERYADGAVVEAPVPAVLIGSGAPPDSHHQVLIQLDTDVPTFFSRFERVLELVHGDAGSRRASRARYKFYRDRGYPLATHDLTAGGGLR